MGALNGKISVITSYLLLLVFINRVRITTDVDGMTSAKAPVHDEIDGGTSYSATGWHGGLCPL